MKRVDDILLVITIPICVLALGLSLTQTITSAYTGNLYIAVAWGFMVILNVLNLAVLWFVSWE